MFVFHILNVFRLNFSHGSIEEHRNNYDLIREIEKESENLNLEDLGGICFNSDIYSIKHENLKTRIYKT